MVEVNEITTNTRLANILEGKHASVYLYVCILYVYTCMCKLAYVSYLIVSMYVFAYLNVLIDSRREIENLTNCDHSHLYKEHVTDLNLF